MRVRVWVRIRVRVRVSLLLAVPEDGSPSHAVLGALGHVSVV